MFSVIESIQAKAGRQGFAPAIINGGRIVTYAELLDLIARISNHLIDSRLPDRSRLFLNMADPDLRLIASLAAIHAGMIPYVLSELENLRGGIDYDFVIGLPVPQVKGLAADIVIDDAVLHGRLSDNHLRDVPDRGDDEMLYLAGTSGTTGRRKLVVTRSGAYRIRSLVNSAIEPTGDRDRVLMTLGDVTKYGFSLSIFLLKNGAAILRPDADRPRMLANANLYGVTQLRTTPAELAAILGVMEAERIRVPTIKYIELSGSLIPQPLVERASSLFNARIRVNYVSAEVGNVSTGLIDPKSFRVGYVGELGPGVNLVSVGTPDAPAPIVISNDRRHFCEYYSNGKVVVEEKPFYSMPDLGYLDGGSLYLIGRQDEVLNLSGNKFPFSTVEMALRAKAGVEDVGMANAPAGWPQAGLVIGVVGAGLDYEELAQAVCVALDYPRAKSSLHFFALPAIRRNQMGKVDRASILDAYRALAGSLH